MRRRSFVFPATATLAAALILAAPASAEEGGIPWADSLAPALDLAEKSGKPVLVDVWAIWCVPCHEMDQTTYRDERVIREAEEFVPLKVDADVKTSFIERFRVDAYPTLLVLDGRGREITRFRGKIETEALLELMRTVREGYATYQYGLERPDDPIAARQIADYFTAVGNAEGAVTQVRACLKSMKAANRAERDAMELCLGETQCAAGSFKAACKTLSRLADEAETSETRGKALLALVRAERERGREDAAAQAVTRLRAEHPELATTAGF